MTQEQIDRITETRKEETLVEIRSPADGFILERNIFLGGAFKPVTTLYTVADLGVVWILADAFETTNNFSNPAQRP